MALNKGSKLNPQAIQVLEECFAEGFSLPAACEVVGISPEWYRHKYREDKSFSEKMDNARLIYYNKVKERVMRRTEKAQDIVDKYFDGRIIVTKTTTKTLADGGKEVTVARAKELVPRWILERYLPIDIKPEEETQEEIIVSVNLADDNPIDNEEDETELTEAFSVGEVSQAHEVSNDISDEDMLENEE